VTGLGTVSPLGNDVAATWDALLNGRSGIGPITRFDATDFTTRIAGEVKNFDPADCLDRKEIKRNDPFVWYALAAVLQAVDQADLDVGSLDPSRFGVIFGSGIGGVSTWEAQHRTLMERGPSRVSPLFVPMMITDMAAGAISMRLKAKGPNFCITSACASGAHSLGESMRAIRHGHADIMVAGGSESAVTELSMAGFCSMKALSTRNDEPTLASRPFDTGRDGFVMGEGAGAVILESLEHATARGANILCEFVGYGATADAHHITAPAPGGEGAARAMALAMEDAGLGTSDIDYINAHGTSTPLNDKYETMAVKSVFGDDARRLAISSTKSMTGHLLGAAGALEFVVSTMALLKGVIPPTINLTDPDPECDLDYVPHDARECQVECIISNSLGFGGHNATLAIQRFGE